ncbi:MAG TPA: hypothetical protein VNT31_00395 [Nocardioides sp.]|nr:hypothetical protein [Nocardioides sp.]
MWWDHDAGWFAWPAMAIGMALFWGVVAVIVIALLRGAGSSGSMRRPDARQLLQERLARGEIDVEEYEQRLEALSKADR